MNIIMVIWKNSSCAIFSNRLEENKLFLQHIIMIDMNIDGIIFEDIFFGPNKPRIEYRYGFVENQCCTQTQPHSQ